MREEAKNVLGTKLKYCCHDPVTGFYRDGFCHTDFSDPGMHSICCLVTEDFLNFSKSQGNDLITPMPQFGFKGIKPGDKWCLCASRWYDAVKAGHGCKIDLEATHEETLAMIPLEVLKEYAL